jgi:mannose-1-phosphate guanylyltransferase
VGYKQEQIINYFNNGTRFDVNITYVMDDPKLKGTGGSLLNVYQKEAMDPSETMIVYYGDIISDINLTGMLKQHHQREAAATLALSKGFKVRVGVAEVNKGDVIRWTEKPTLPINVGIGILILNASVLPELAIMSKQYAELDIMSHLIPRLLEKGEVVQAYVSDTFWYDVGSAEAYEKLDNHFIEKRLEYLLT